MKGFLSALLMVLVVALCAQTGSAKYWYTGSGSCGGVVDPDTLPVPPTGWDPLNKYHRYGDWPGEIDISTVNPTFANIFDVWVTEHAIPAWDSAMVADMTFRVVDADSTNESDVFPKVWSYFLKDSVDEDPTYGGIRYTFSDDSTYTRIILRLWNLYDFSGACAYPAYRLECGTYATALRPPAGHTPYRAYNILLNAPDSLWACDGPGRAFTLDEFTNLFGHELQHVCFGLNGHTATYDKVDESLSKLAEYVIGSIPNKDCDVSYDASVIRGDRCEAWRKYATEEIWMSYLYDRFPGSTSDPEDDLVYTWLRGSQVTLPALAQLLAGAEYAWLGGSTADERLQALFQAFAVARFANAPELTSDRRYGYERFDPVEDLGLTLDNCVFYDSLPCPKRPIDCAGNLPPNGCMTSVGCWNVKIIPPDYALGSANENTTATVSAIYEDADLSRDSVEVATYGADYIVFRAGSYFADGGLHEFRFSMNKLAGAMPGNSVLQASIIAYSTVADTLQLHPENILFVSPLEIRGGDAGASCVVTDFGRSVKAVVVVISLAEETAAALSGSDLEYYVYEYEYGVSTPASANVTWDGSVFVLSDRTVPTTKTLTVDPGTIVRVATSDAAAGGVDTTRIEFNVEGGLVADGTAASPIVFDSWDPQTTEDWVGFYFDSLSAGGTFEHCVISRAEYAIESYVDLTVKNTTIENCRYAGVVAQDGIALVQGCTITDPGTWGIFLTAADVTMRATTVENAVSAALHVQPNASVTATSSSFLDSDVGVYVNCTADVTLDSSCVVKHNDLGVECYSASGPAVLIRASVIDSNTTAGVYCDHFSHPTVDSCAIGQNPTGIYCSDHSDPLVKSCVVSNNTTAGVSCNYYSGPTVDDCAIGYNPTGIYCSDHSDPLIKSCEISNSTVGISAVYDAEPDLGHMGVSGQNAITASSSHHVANLSTGVTIMAEDNWWGKAPPKASKFSGSVDYTPYLGSAPSPVAMKPETPEKLPTTWALGAATPNPFNPTTTVHYDVPDPGGVVAIRVYDVAGRLVRELVNGFQPAGFQQVIWDGASDRGEPIASGVYFVQMKSGAFVEAKKLVLLK